MKEFLKSRSGIEISIASKVFNNERITDDEAFYLYENSDIAFCGFLANYIKAKRFGKNVFYNKNTHVEISNLCINKCKFCSFYREKGMSDCWDLNIPDVIEILNNKSNEGLTEVHITGGLHPEKTTLFYSELFENIKAIYPHIHIKAFTAVEIEYFSKSDKLSTKDILKTLKSKGLGSLAGGGAEILDNEIRKKICPEKTDSEIWLKIHKEAHEVGLSSNCTMLYGHIENFKDRIIHMNKLRTVQDTTGGFNCFIPLKFKSHGNQLGINEEINLMEELKNYAISRIYLDNIEHLKAYWPMTGIETAVLSLAFGVDDFDGTISNSTKIYSMAGSKENPNLTETEIIKLINDEGFIAVERDSCYSKIAI
jgi:aminodeoxyfutalosine synthase